MLLLGAAILVEYVSHLRAREPMKYATLRFMVKNRLANKSESWKICLGVTLPTSPLTFDKQFGIWN